jgi:hypothetical protein
LSEELELKRHELVQRTMRFSKPIVFGLTLALSFWTLISRAEIQGISNRDKPIIECKAPFPKPAEPQVLAGAAFRLCKYESVACSVTTVMLKGLIIPGQITVRCPSNEKGCPLVVDCARAVFTSEQQEQLLLAQDPNMGNYGAQPLGFDGSMGIKKRGGRNSSEGLSR